MKVQSVAVALAVLATSSVFAQSAPKNPVATPRIDQREANQEKRIDNGIASGQLTQKEAKRLDNGEERIENAEDRAKEDGKVTHKERKRLRRMEDVESRAIYRQKHDRQTDMNHDGKRDLKAGQ